MVGWSIRTVFLLAVLLLAAITDTKYGKIPNKLVFAGMVIGLLFSPSLSALLFKILGIVFLYFFGMLRLMGFGDIKLWMVIVSFSGFLPSCWIVLIGSLLLIGYVMVKNTKEADSIIRITVWQAVHLRKFTRPEQTGYPFAPFLFTGAAIYLLIQLGRMIL